MNCDVTCTGCCINNECVSNNDCIILFFSSTALLLINIAILACCGCCVACGGCYSFIKFWIMKIKEKIKSKNIKDECIVNTDAPNEVPDNTNAQGENKYSTIPIIL